MGNKKMKRGKRKKIKRTIQRKPENRRK